MEGATPQNQQHHFVLVHGACHGAWCWYKVVTILRSSGHRVTALDMAASGVNLKHVEELNSLSDYCQPLIDFMASLPSDEKVVLVAHSMGGFCVSLAMEVFPDKIALAVFAAAFMPGPDLPDSVAYAEFANYGGDSYMDAKYFFANGDSNPPTAMLFGDEFMASQLYQLSPSEDLTLATMLVRPVVLDLGLKDTVLSEEKYGSVKRGYVVCDEDNILKQGFQEWLIQKNPVDEVKTIEGADHMVMFSKPLELCSCLQDLAHQFNPAT